MMRTLPKILVCSFLLLPATNAYAVYNCGPQASGTSSPEQCTW